MKSIVALRWNWQAVASILVTKNISQNERKFALNKQRKHQVEREWPTSALITILMRKCRF